MGNKFEQHTGLLFLSFLLQVQFLFLFFQQCVVLVDVLLVRFSVPEDCVVQRTRHHPFTRMVSSSMIKQIFLVRVFSSAICQNLELFSNI